MGGFLRNFQGSTDLQFLIKQKELNGLGGEVAREASTAGTANTRKSYCQPESALQIQQKCSWFMTKW